MDFLAALDAGGEGISHQVSEVNIANPEDVQAIIPDSGSSNADILVHFGEEKYLERYHQYQAHLAEWRAQYPKLASVDMRYEQQVVLDMHKDAAAPVAATNGSHAGASSSTVAAKSSASVKRSVVAKPRISKPKVRPVGIRERVRWHAAAMRARAQAVAQ